MAMTVKDFLKKYYRQLHFNYMDPDVRTRFNKYIERDSLTSTMREWRDTYMHLERGQNGEPDKYVENKIPNVMKEEDLPDDVARELFVLFQNAFVGMNGAIATYQKSDPISAAFVNRYFGDNKLFNVSPASNECKAGIKALVDTIRNNKSIQNYLLTQTIGDKKLFNSHNDLDTFLSKCDKGDYDKKSDVQEKLKNIANNFSDLVKYDNISERLKPIVNLSNAGHLDNILDENAFSIAPEAISDKKIKEFRNNIVKETGVLKTLYRSKTIRDRFAKYDNGYVQITDMITTEAIDKIDYQKTDSANYVPPKTEDTLTPLQQMKKWCSDTYDDTFKKYERLRGAPLFFSSEAEDIFKAVDKAGVRPNDGLKGMVDKASDIEKNLADTPQAKGYFKWFLDTMNDVKNKIPKAFEGAWSDSTQMQAVITQIILKAADPENDDPEAMEKAMASMEIMNAMKYGMLTSNLVDAMSSTEFSLFSDGKLSWNKNEGIQFLTKALDKSIKFAFKSIGLGASYAWNRYKMRKKGFTDEDNQNGALGKAFKAQQEMIQSDKDIEKDDVAEIKQRKKETKGILDDLDSKDQINRKTIKDKEKEISDREKDLQNMESGEAAFQEQMGVLRGKMELEKEISVIEDKIPELKKAAKDAKKEFEKSMKDGYKNMPEQKQKQVQVELYDKWQEAKQALESQEKSLKDKKNQLVANAASYAAAQKHITDHKMEHVAYKRASQEYTDLKEKTEAFRTATAELKDINKTLREKNAAMKNWNTDHVNKVIVLEKFWNDLQTGVTKTYAFSRKSAQEEFNETQKAALMQQIMSTTTLGS